ncbi:MAG: hypothetical protein GY817_09140 [bacterium]|nr:hypothetical protein [bacterium]
MSPNANARNSPTSVVDLTPIVTIVDRDYDIDTTKDMFAEHMNEFYEREGYRPQWCEDIFRRLDMIKLGMTVVWIPCCNTGTWLDVEEWFTMYGFAPDMVVPGAYVDNEAEVMHPESIEVTLGRQDAEEDAREEALLDAWRAERLEDIVLDSDDFSFSDSEDTETTCSITLGSQDTVEN